MKYIFTYDDMLITFKKGQMSKDDETFLIELNALKKCRIKQRKEMENLTLRQKKFYGIKLLRIKKG